MGEARVGSRGRPPLPEEQKRVRIGYSLSPEDFDRFCAIARRYRTNPHRLSVLVMTRFIRHTKNTPSTVAC